MVDVRAKGAKAETDVRNMLRKHTNLTWERTPGSGALDPKHMLKGDLHVPGEANLYCVEFKHYADDHINSGILTHKLPQIIEWWQQTLRQGNQVGRKPLLIFKFNRSKIFVSFEDMPNSEYRYMFIKVDGHELYIALLEDWLIHDKPKFIK